VVTKSLAAYEWPGNPAPRLHPTPQGMINAVGLQGPGVRYWLDHVVGDLVATGATVVASIWGRSLEDYAQAAELLAAAPPEVVAVEVNLSCPNLEGRGSIFAHDASLSADVIAATAACGRPRWAKLSANTDRIIDVADAVMGAGAEAVTSDSPTTPRRWRRRWAPAGEGCRGEPSTPLPSVRSMTSTGRCPTSRSSGSAVWRRRGTRSS
jgi:dihydroorotate dehydrogenase (NAD+) catalytic subunit